MTGESAFHFIKEVWKLCMVVIQKVSRLFFPNVYKLFLNYVCGYLSCLVFV